MTKFSVETSVQLTGDGKAGAAMFILAPIAIGIIYPFLSIEATTPYNPYGSSSALIFLSFLMLLSVLAFFGGIVMLVLGRRYEHRVEIQRE